MKELYKNRKIQNSCLHYKQFLSLGQNLKIFPIKSRKYSNFQCFISQIHNHFNVPIEVYYMTAKDTELESVAVVEPGASFNVPFKAVYTPTGELFFSVAGYSVTTQSFVWKDLQMNLNVTKNLKCSPKLGEICTDPFIIKVSQK